MMGWRTSESELDRLIEQHQQVAALISEKLAACPNLGEWPQEGRVLFLYELLVGISRSVSLIAWLDRVKVVSDP